MAQTYSQLQFQIAELKSKADALRKEELAAVVGRMRADIKAYEITVQDLFGNLFGKAGKAKTKSSSQPKFGDGSGNVWVGRGPRPQWLRDALAAGKKLEEFVFGASAPKAEPAAAPAAKKVAAKKAAAKKAPAKKAAAKKKASAPVSAADNG
jgi:DNA-binding protein H-NS